jgi:ferrous iron transport protein B
MMSHAQSPRGGGGRRTIALVGNPNSGKTTVFNALTGLRQKVANYPGVTVERHEGSIRTEDGRETLILDLPGTYSLRASSPDEAIAVDVMLGRAAHTPRPDLIVCVVDASNLERNLYLVSQIIDRRLPVMLALNMIDVARGQGIILDAGRIEMELGVPVVPIVASTGKGIDALRRAIAVTPPPSARAREWTLPEAVHREAEELAGMLIDSGKQSESSAFSEAVDLLTSHAGELDRTDRFDREILDHVRIDHEKLNFLGFDRESVAVSARYAWLRQVVARSTRHTAYPGITPTDRLDRILTHRVWGLVVFLALMALMFQAIFTWAMIPMELIGEGFDALGRGVSGLLPAGTLQDLIVNGAIAGVAAVVVFLPQILFLFFFLTLLEDTGYMARAAYVMDRLMGRFGLPGKAFIPLLSSFACAIPGIMAARTIEKERDRLATMFIAPFMGCSARLPVYTLVIAAVIPATSVMGIFSLPALTMFSLYVLGVVVALFIAWVLKRTLLRGVQAELLLELPAYKIPSLKSIFLTIWERAIVFLKQAGTIILGASIVMWFLASYPSLDHGTPSERVEHSFAGRAGRLIEPVIEPLGFNWKIGIGLISSLFQREVFVSTMGTIYNIEEGEAEGTGSLAQLMRDEIDPETGLPTFTMPVALALLVYYVLAMQCLSTVAIMRRETNGWKWPALQFAVMTGLAYAAAFIVFQVGTTLGVT